MNGSQIEHVLGLIDQNLKQNNDQVAAYIKQNQTEIARCLVDTGKAVLRTPSGDVSISLADLEAVAV